MEFTKDEYLEAVTNGVKQAFLEMMDATDIIRTEQVMEKIREGVQDAMWQLATNATDAPCADFYEHIKLGVKEAMEFKNVFCSCEKEDDE